MKKTNFTIRSKMDVEDYIEENHSISKHPHEVTLILLLNQSNEVIGEVINFFTSYDMTGSRESNFRKEIFQEVMEYENCSGMITVHFSAVYADTIIGNDVFYRLAGFNKRLNNIAASLNMPILDSVVNIPGGFTSLKEKGLL